MALDPRVTRGVPLYCRCCGEVFDSCDLMTETCPRGCVTVQGSRTMPVDLEEIGEESAHDLMFGCD